MLEDYALIQRCQNGDLDAFATLFQQHQQRIYNLARTILRHETEAEDVVQDTFLAVFRQIDTFRGNAAFTTWLTTIAINQCRTRLRRYKLRRILSLEWLSERQLVAAVNPAGNPATLIAAGEDANALWQLVDQLNDRLRLPLILRYRYDFSAQEIAKMLDSNPNRIYQQLYEGRQRLRQLAQQQGIHFAPAEAE